MLAWIRSPRGSTATATVVAVILALFWLAPWQKPLPSGLRLPFATALPAGPASAPAAPVPVAPAGPATATTTTPAAPAAIASRAPADPGPAAGGAPVGQGPAAAAAPATSAKDAETVPAFDVVRVEPTGEAVIAGRAAPGSEVALMDGETVIAHVRADPTGQFAFLPPALAEGSHDLSLQTQAEGQAPVRSVQGVAISVAPHGATKPLVALLSPDQPAEVLSDGGPTPATNGSGGAAAGANRVGGPVGPGAAAPVAIQSVQAGQNGNFLAAGVAHPGSQCRVYLNGAYLADVTAGQDGKWSVEIKKGMKPGRYTVRADELDPAGAVSQRAEVPFEYPAANGSAGTAKRRLLSRNAPDAITIAPAGSAPASGSAAATAVASSAPMTAAMSQAAGSRAPTGSPPTAAGPATGGAPDIVAGLALPSASTTPSGASPSPAAAVIADLHTTTVIRGDSLWRISRKMLGHGIQYTEIYASNTQQIRNPALIYPGQIFVVPSKHPNP